MAYYQPTRQSKIDKSIKLVKGRHKGRSATVERRDTSGETGEQSNTEREREKEDKW